MPSMMSRSLPLLMSALALFASGCQFGGASFSGDFDGRPFEPGGTVFSYVDGYDDSLVEVERPRVAVFMSWLMFDPAADLNDRPGTELEDLKHELRLRDAMALVFDDQVDVSAGASFTTELSGGQVVSSDGLMAQIHLAPERLTSASTYAAFRPFGSSRVVSVGIDEAGFVEGGARLVRGSISVDISVSDTDPADARVGRVEGEFTAPLVDERMAEHNLSLLSVEDVLGLPLGPN